MCEERIYWRGNVYMKEDVKLVPGKQEEAPDIQLVPFSKQLVSPAEQEDVYLDLFDVESILV